MEACVQQAIERHHINHVHLEDVEPTQHRLVRWRVRDRVHDAERRQYLDETDDDAYLMDDALLVKPAAAFRSI